MYLRLFIFLVVSLATAYGSGYLKQTLLKNPVKRSDIEPFQLFDAQTEQKALKLKPALVELGRSVFFDERFSVSGNFSCATCHRPEFAYGDQVAISEPLKKHSFPINTPPLSLLAAQEFFFHDGHASRLEGAIQDHIERDEFVGRSSLAVAQYVIEFRQDQWKEVWGYNLEPLAQWLSQRADGESLMNAMPALPYLAIPDAMRELWELYKVSSDVVPKDWVDLYQQLPEFVRTSSQQITGDLVQALSAFLISIKIERSPFDRFIEKSMAGGLGAQFVPGFGSNELEGFELFVGSAGCVSCHSGPYFSDGLFHNTGLARGDRRILGRSEGLILCAQKASCEGEALDSEDSALFPALGQMRTPSLRYLRYTAPYLHDGSFQDLKALIGAYSEGTHYGLGEQDARIRSIQLSDRQVDQLAAFLMSLSPSERNL